MSCPNFEFMDYDLPLIVAQPGIEEMGYDEAKDEYEDANDEEYTYDMYISDLQIEYDSLACDMEYYAENINDNLRFFTVNVKDGYYTGIQFTVESEYNFDKDSPYCIDNYDAQYEFGECRSKVLRKAKTELNRIRKWLLSMKEKGFIELNCNGVFNNGEAVYSVAA